MLYELPEDYINELKKGAPVRALDIKYGIDKNISPILRANAGFHVSRHESLNRRIVKLTDLLMKSSTKKTQRQLCDELSWSIGTLQKVLKAIRSYDK